MSKQGNLGPIQALATLSKPWRVLAVQAHWTYPDAQQVTEGSRLACSGMQLCWFVLAGVPSDQALSVYPYRGLLTG